MKSNINRRQEIFRDVIPVYGSKEYNDMVEFLQNESKRNPKMKEFTKKSLEKVMKSLEAQTLSQCGLITEKTLRYFLYEFNNRAWKHGLRSLPMMFNILEAFFIYRKPEIYFELIEEENYLISYFDFIDFITSKDFVNNQKIIEESLTSDIIYNFNIGKDLKDIKFKTDDNNEFIITGISLIRRNNEVTILVNTGKKEKNTISIDKETIDLDFDNPDKSRILNEFNENLKSNKIESEYIDEEKEYIKVVVACRIDLETMTIDARYIAEETNLMFNVITDEIDGFLNSEGNFISEQFKKAFDQFNENINNYDAIFEAAKMSLFLPYYLRFANNFFRKKDLEFMS